MLQLSVTRNRATRILTTDDLHAILRGDVERTYQIMPQFVMVNGQYADLPTARSLMGRLTLRQFVQATERFKDDLAVTPKERSLIDLAFTKGTKTAPGWMWVLNAAHDWGQLPWIVAGDGHKELWTRRYRIVEGIRAKKK